MAVNPDEDRFNEGISLIKAGKIEEAIDLFSELVEKDERNHKAWNAYGVALSQTAHKDSAIHCFENALLLDPGNKIYRRNLSRVKTPPAKRGPPKMTELTEEDKGMDIRIIGVAVIISLVIIGSIIVLLVSGIIPGFSLTEGKSGALNDENMVNKVRSNISISNETMNASIEPENLSSPVGNQTLITPPPPEVLFHFIDVSQGDAALVQSQGKNLLIDAGPPISGKRLVKYLHDHNVTSLDLVVASHPYDDHIGGMIDVLKEFPVKTYVDNGVVHSSDLYKEVIGSVISNQAFHLIAAAGTGIPFTSDTKIEVLGPFRLTGHQEEDSVVLRLSVKNVSVIFPGDASQVKGPATILKIPDHGSNNAIASIVNTRPEAAIISVASGNTFDYPRSATLDALEKQGSKVFRTDVNGSIIISTGGENWTVKTTR